MDTSEPSFDLSVQAPPTPQAAEPPTSQPMDTGSSRSDLTTESMDPPNLLIPLDHGINVDEYRPTTFSLDITAPVVDQQDTSETPLDMLDRSFTAPAVTTSSARDPLGPLLSSYPKPLDLAPTSISQVPSPVPTSHLPGPTTQQIEAPPGSADASRLNESMESEISSAGTPVQDEHPNIHTPHTSPVAQGLPSFGTPAQSTPLDLSRDVDATQRAPSGADSVVGPRHFGETFLPPGPHEVAYRKVFSDREYGHGMDYQHDELVDMYSAAQQERAQAGRHSPMFLDLPMSDHDALHQSVVRSYQKSLANRTFTITAPQPLSAQVPRRLPSPVADTPASPAPHTAQMDQTFDAATLRPAHTQAPDPTIDDEGEGTFSPDYEDISDEQ